MEQATYEVEARVQATHWWFVGRRRLFSRLLQRLPLPRASSVLDIGTGTGSNLRLLREMGFENLCGVDASEAALHYSRQIGFPQVQLGDVKALPFESQLFQLVVATDILEHVDDDAGALNEIARMIAPGGWVLLTVPAFQCLWGLQDNVSHHKRRYRLKAFRAMVRKAGLEVERSFYFNYLLFMPILAARRLRIADRAKLKSENELNSPWLNSLLKLCFHLDLLTAPLLHPPFGVTCLVLARKPAG